MPFARRPHVYLDGRWQFTVIDVPGRQAGSTVEVAVPGSWTLQVPGAETAHGTVRYSRELVVPADWPSEGHLVLRFGAVNHAARVSVNGTVVGHHVGGWTPFEVEVDRALLTGDGDRLDVLVSNPPLMSDDDATIPMQEYPHGKQTWYGTSGGIWQSVELEHRPAQHLARTRVRTEASSGRVRCTATLAAPAAAGSQVRVVVTGDGRTAAARTVEVPAATADDVGAVGARTGPTLRVDVVVPDARLWSPDSPSLYEVVVELVVAGAVVDAEQVTTGFRSVTTQAGQVLLNGEPIELRGVLDQDYHPGSELRSGSADELERLLGEAKRLGFNLLRCHIKRPDPAYFAAADRLGLMVWAELPSWQRFTDRAAARAEALLEEMVDLDGHHPSIVVWTVVNESWGVDVRDAEQRAWMAATQQRVKELAPSTLVVDNSACESNFHVRSDLDDFHAYRAIPEHRDLWDAWVEEFASRPDWTYSPHGDAHRTGAEPLVLSEFGSWGLPDMADALLPDGSEPWWADAGQDWAFGAAHGSGVMQRFERLGLAEVFGSWRGFVEATQRLQLLADRYQIGSIRRRPEIAGYVLTQLSDVQWEANGLFDMDRRPRIFLDELALINGPATVVLRPEAYAGRPGDTLGVRVDVVPPRGGVPPDQRWTVVLEVDGQAVEELPVVAGQRSTVAGKVLLPPRTALVAVAAALRVDGALRGRDVADVTVVATPTTREQAVCTTDLVLADWLRSLDVPVTQDPGAARLLVTRQLDERAQAHARSGARTLVIAEDLQALGGAFAAPLLARLSQRAGEDGWVPRADWLRRSAPFAGLPGGPLFDLGYESVIGDLVIDFLPAPLRPARLHSAVFSGWLQHRASTSLTVSWSKGAVTITTLRLRAAGVEDPVAVALTRAMLDAAEE